MRLLLSEGRSAREAGARNRLSGRGPVVTHDVVAAAQGGAYRGLAGCQVTLTSILEWGLARLTA